MHAPKNLRNITSSHNNDMVTLMTSANELVIVNARDTKAINLLLNTSKPPDVDSTERKTE